MKIDKFANMLGIDWDTYGCFNILREKMDKRKQQEYFVYREDYVLTGAGKIKEPSIYKFDRYFTKVKGSGHSEFGAWAHDSEYEIFLTRESALEYATQVQKEFFKQKEQDEIKKTQEEIELLHALAEKFNYTLIKN